MRENNSGFKIDESQRQSWLSIAAVWAGGMICVPCLMIGGVLAGGGLSLGQIVLSILIVYGLMLKIFTGLSYGRFLKKYSRIALVPFSTSSSNATLPYSIEFCRSIGVSEKVASFTLPLGATLNMDGSAIMQGMTAVFVAQLYNIELTWPMIVTIVIAATLGTIGSPGMPGVVMVTLTVVLQSVGFPLEAIAIIVAIDKFPDMFKTVLNVLGDSVDTVIVAKSEGEFDADVFNGLKEADVNVGE